MEKITVLVVDDSAFMRKVITDILNSDPDITVVGQAADGLEALQKVQELNPQVVSLDMVMPRLDGLQTIHKLMERSPQPKVIMVSGLTSEEASITLECLEAGAVDFILKPSGPLSSDMGKVRLRLISAIKTAVYADVGIFKGPPLMATIAQENNHEHPGVVVIGSSTGGPVALEYLLPLFPDNLTYPILVAQHLPLQFVESLVNRLTKNCHLPVQIAKDEEQVLPGVIYFAPGGADTEVIRVGNDQIQFSVRKSDETLTPSVNKLMESTAKTYKNTTVGVILTGMGDDGLLGMAAIKEAGGKTLVQDEKSCVVFGMGKVVVEQKLADQIVPLNELAGYII